jgi:hypothetical protein
MATYMTKSKINRNDSPIYHSRTKRYIREVLKQMLKQVTKRP